MKGSFIFSFLMISLVLVGQDRGFECDDSHYVISYTQSTGISTLFKVTENSHEISYSAIELSENRRLNSLAYNVLDRHLYALDVDSYELVKIDNQGLVRSMGRPENIDTSYIFNSGSISPDGDGIFLIGYSPEFGHDNRFYSINLRSENLYAGFLGITGDRKYEIHDMATDPLSGEMYGYDNREGRLTQIVTGGQITSVRFVTAGFRSMDGIFFNQKGELFGYSAESGFFSISKHDGEIEFLSSGPEGTNGDACSCPYTSSFIKEIEPRQILPCEEFKVTYTFQNSLGIGQTWIKLRDTFPEDFEIVSVDSRIISAINIVNSPKNILSLENFIYLMGENKIEVTIRAPSDFLGEFDSQATQWDFPFALQEYQYSDDPNTENIDDPTSAIIIGAHDLNFDQSLAFNCEGTDAIISSPISANTYQWSNGSSDSSITVNETGWYTLLAENDCLIYYDSVFVSSFPEEKNLVIDGRPSVILGDSVRLTSTLNRGLPILYQWIIESDTIKCQSCFSIVITPSQTSTYELLVSDSEGCWTSTYFDIEVEQVRYLYAANAFSPNNDGVNDNFYLQSSSPGMIKKLTVYNRWGSEIYKGVNLPLNQEAFGWNGMIAQQTASSGVYIWIAEIEYFDGHTETKSGPVTLFAQR